MTNEEINTIASNYTEDVLESTNIPIDEALSGDIVIAVSPSTVTRTATSAGFSRTIRVALETADGRTHSWFNGTLPIAASKSSTAGTIAIKDSATVITLVNGIGNVVVNGSATAWLANDTNTLTVSKNANVPLFANVAATTSVETII